jgi:hypothetical protein
MKDQKALEKGAELIQKELRKQLRDQGHYLTGALERSIVSRVVLSSEQGTTIEGVAINYAGILDQGTTPARIPFGGGPVYPRGQRAPASGKTSKYIEALKNYFIARGLDEKEALSAAFGTAHKQKMEGMPTEASRRFAKGGVRTFFIEVTEIALGRKVQDTVMSEIKDLISKTINKTKSETI